MDILQSFTPLIEIGFSPGGGGGPWVFFGWVIAWFLYPVLENASEMDTPF